MKHVYCAGPVVVQLVPIGGSPAQLNPPQSGTLKFPGKFDATQLAGPLAGKTLADFTAAAASGNIYVNVHSTDYPAGVVRGTLTSKSVPSGAEKLGFALSTFLALSSMAAFLF